MALAWGLALALALALGLALALPLRLLLPLALWGGERGGRVEGWRPPDGSTYVERLP